MGLRDKLRKRDGTPEEETVGEKSAQIASGSSSSNNNTHGAPEFTFLRSDTSTIEIIQPPDNDGDGGGRASSGAQDSSAPHHLSPAKEPGGLRRSLSIFHSSRSRSTSVSSQASQASSSFTREGSHRRRRRLSERLHLRHAAPESSDSVPQNLPAIVGAATTTAGGPAGDKDAVESQWEQRATLLAGQNELARGIPGSPVKSESMASSNIRPGSPAAAAAAAAAGRSRSRSPSGAQPVSSKAIDEDIQEAIRLHEEGQLERSTQIFGRLADANGANNPLSQVLYGLALRHGWGCAPDTEKAVTYLSAAASNAATVEQMALQAGMKKGGAAKGELVLAIFELANCFRHGWGVPRDAVAAKQYYETAANLGDTDAMNEAAWCYLEGFGCKKDKFAAAQYYRLAENAGNKTLGNSWIWKEKYDPEAGKAKKKR